MFRTDLITILHCNYSTTNSTYIFILKQIYFIMEYYAVKSLTSLELNYKIL